MTERKKRKSVEISKSEKENENRFLRLPRSVPSVFTQKELGVYNLYNPPTVSVSTSSFNTSSQVRNLFSAAERYANIGDWRGVLGLINDFRLSRYRFPWCRMQSIKLDTESSYSIGTAATFWSDGSTNKAQLKPRNHKSLLQEYISNLLMMYIQRTSFEELELKPQIKEFEAQQGFVVGPFWEAIKGLSEFQKVSERMDDEFKAFSVITDAPSQSTEHSELLNEIADLLKDAPPNSTFVIIYSMIKLWLGREEEVRVYLKSLVKEFPNHPKFLREYGALLITHFPSNNRIVKIFNELLKIDPSSLTSIEVLSQIDPRSVLGPLSHNISMTPFNINLWIRFQDALVQNVSHRSRDDHSQTWWRKFHFTPSRWPLSQRNLEDPSVRELVKVKLEVAKLLLDEEDPFIELLSNFLRIN